MFGLALASVKAYEVNVDPQQLDHSSARTITTLLLHVLKSDTQAHSYWVQET